jgi:hypothetical protein
MIATVPTSARRQSAGLTPRGLAVAYTYRLRQALESLPADQQRELLGDLRDLVDEYAPRRPSPAA